MGNGVEWARPEINPADHRKPMYIYLARDVLLVDVPLLNGDIATKERHASCGRFSATPFYRHLGNIVSLTCQTGCAAVCAAPRHETLL